MQPSSALFPDVSSSSRTSTTIVHPTHEEESSDSPDESGSPDVQQPDSHQDDSPDAFQTQLKIDFSSPGTMGFPDTQAIETFPHDAAPDRLASPFVGLDQSLDPASTASSHCGGFASPNMDSVKSEQLAFPFQSMVGAEYANASVASFHTQSSGCVGDMDNSSVKNESHEGFSRGFGHSDHPQNIPSPGDSFKSPPPPANIASRRNIRRPATLQAVALKTRQHGSKIDGSIRRIASTNGSGPGRIQKSSVGPRSPMNISKQDAWIHFQQYRNGPMTAPFPGAAPPTPMTPVIAKQPGFQEPTVSSNCSDDDALVLGVLPPGYTPESNPQRNLKTPPQSPGVIGNFTAPDFMADPYNYTELVEQQVFTPFNQANFPEFAMIPDYVDGSDGSLPATPLYPHMVNTAHSQSTLVTNGQVRIGYDWDANKPVLSSKSSPGHPKSRLLQFAKNMTPRNYPQSQER